jgi:deazaflavin-dependent oxidoreductase (nitroreductase family)
MGLAADLGYHHARANLLQRGVQAITSTRPGAWLMSRILARADAAVTSLTRGRVSLPRLLAGLPVLVLTSTGRRSGQPRSTHLIALPFGDTVALLGTNFGQAATPAWVLNLEADPRASVSYDGVTCEVVARAATEEERSRILAASKSIYGGYAKYQQRITGRRLRTFVLEPVSPPR